MGKDRTPMEPRGPPPSRHQGEIGRPEICSAGGEGLRKWAPKSESQFCLFFFYPMLMGEKKILKKIFTPLLYVQNDQRVMGIILRYVCWGTH